MPPLNDELSRAFALLLENFADWPKDGFIDEIMLFLLNHGVKEDVAEEALVSLFAA